MLNIGIIGYGYWGANVTRNFAATPDVNLSVICDPNAGARARARRQYPNTAATSRSSDVFRSGAVDAVAVVTPVSTHFSLAKKALESGRHVFVAKPFTTSVREAEQLVEIADGKKLQIMVDHTYLYSGAVGKLKEIISKNVLGRLYYYDSQRVNLGIFQHDVNVLWDLAPHDLSVLDYLIQGKPVGVQAIGIDHFQTGYEDIAYLTVYYSGSLIAHFNLNWLSPVKVRLTFIGGEKRSVVWDDLETDAKVRIYNSRVEAKIDENRYNTLFHYRSGDMLAPKLELAEPLKKEAAAFVDCVSRNRVSRNDGHSGIRVVRLLEAAQKSLREKGAYISLD